MSVHLFFEFLTAFVGTIAFALLFQVPKEYYVNCGLAGGCGWICYKLLLAGCGLFGSTFFATVLVVFLSRLSAVRRHCPVTIFLVAGIFPLVPGAVSERLSIPDQRLSGFKEQSGNLAGHAADDTV